MIINNNCPECEHEHTTVCDDCSVRGDGSCSCHINPPCGYCTDNKFLEKEGGKKMHSTFRWNVRHELLKAESEEEVLAILQAYYLSHTSDFACNIKAFEKAVRRMRPILWGECTTVGSDYYVDSLLKYMDRRGFVRRED